MRVCEVNDCMLEDILAALSLEHRSSIILKFSELFNARPPETTILAVVKSGRSDLLSSSPSQEVPLFSTFESKA